MGFDVSKVPPKKGEQHKVFVLMGDELHAAFMAAIKDAGSTRSEMGRQMVAQCLRESGYLTREEGK